jgi:23S rRNA-/tRNA-specific pseudouridylate synthase
MNGKIYIRLSPNASRIEILPIIHSDEHCIAVPKPAKTSCKTGAYSILGQICENLHKPSMQRTGLENPGLVYQIDDGMSGILLIAKNSESTATLRNAYGSYLFTFIFELLCRKSPVDKTNEIVCTLPIAVHSSASIRVISSKSGKKSCTIFKFVEDVGEYERWQAKCTYVRRDQVCLHARESGLSILGDEVYCGEKIPPFAELKRDFKTNRKKDNDKPYHGIMAHLSTLKLHTDAVIRSELPRKMQVCIGMLGKL